jgi:hypothetical protein
MAVENRKIMEKGKTGTKEKKEKLSEKDCYFLEEVI